MSLCFCALLRAAEPTGTIAGSILDPSGAAVPNAKVTATALGTGLTRGTKSGSDGQFVIPLLPVGVYSITVEVTGFERFEQRGIEVRVDQNSTVPVTLKIGSTTQLVTVEANAQMVETRSGSLSQLITERNVVDLPLNGRNAAALILLTAGTADLGAGNANGGGDVSSNMTKGFPSAQAISTNGARAETVNYFLDGGSNQDQYLDVNRPFPNPDAVEEFSVQTNSYSAEFGRAAGAVVNVVSKSGTNAWHGTAFEFLRNGKLNARNYFAAAQDQLKRNQYGGSLGGPIKKDNLFIFGTYQGTPLRDLSAGNSATVPTDAQRIGDFSALLPGKQLKDPSTGLNYTDNQIPSSQFAAASLQLLDSVPHATDSTGVIHYTKPINSSEEQFMGRADYTLSKHRIYGRYFNSHFVSQRVAGTTNIITSAAGRDQLTQTVAVSDTYNIGTNMMNSVLFSFNRGSGAVTSGAPLSWKDLALPIAVTNPPELNLAVSGYFSIASGHYSLSRTQEYRLSDSLHWMTGSHEIAMGGEFMRVNWVMNNTWHQNGLFKFNGAKNSGNSVADFLIGYTNSFLQGGGQYLDESQTVFALFFQDKYRVNRDLVLSLGLRWDPFFPFTDSEGRVECFRPGLGLQSQRFSNAPEGYLYAGDPGCPQGGFRTSWKELGPRLGFAYNPGGNSKTTVRGGAGLFYQPPFFEAFGSMAVSAPFSPQYTLYKVPFMNPYVGTTNPFPAQFGPQAPPSTVAIDIPLLGVSYDHNWTPSRIMNWNLTVEHQFAKDVLARIGYVASVGRHLSYNTDANAPLPSPTATADNEDARRPYQQFLQMTQDQSGANSGYNALQVSVEKRFSRGVSVSANYNWGKSIDTVSWQTDMDTINIVDPYNLNAFRAVSEYNVPHRFVLNYIWQLPSPKHGLAKAFLGGWQTSGIWSWQSGFPLNITSGGDYSFSIPANSNDQAQLVSTPQYTTGSRGNKIAQWFTTSAFTTPPDNTFGNVGRNTLIGPGTFNVDFGVHKVFSLGERVKLQYRAEFFNVFNHPLLNNPDTIVTDSTFGQITTARDPRILQMALKLIF
jgi:hypothetical protein